MADKEIQPVIRGDGSRRRAAELRSGLRAYRAWLAGFVDGDVFARFLFDGDVYPEVDLAEVCVESLAYQPPPLTMNYSLAHTPARSVRDDFGFSDNGGRSRARINGAVDRFAAHRRWQELIGEKAPNVKLTEGKVVEIRERYASGGISRAKLAKEYGVSPPAIGAIVWGSTWIYAPGPVKCRQVMRARCTQEARYNRYGERVGTEEHPRLEMLTDEESATLAAIEQRREDERYVTRSEVTAWTGTKPVHYEWGTYVPITAKLRLAAPPLAVHEVDSQVASTGTPAPRENT